MFRDYDYRNTDLILKIENNFIKRFRIKEIKHVSLKKVEELV